MMRHDQTNLREQFKTYDQQRRAENENTTENTIRVDTRELLNGIYEIEMQERK